MRFKSILLAAALSLAPVSGAFAQTVPPPIAIPTFQAKWDRLVEDYSGAQIGIAVFQTDVGVALLGNQAVPADYPLAEAWLNAAAAQGNARAQAFLGFMYKDGNGVPQDYAVAADWLRKAADQGNSSAQYMLGILSALRDLCG